MLEYNYDILVNWMWELFYFNSGFIFIFMDECVINEKGVYFMENFYLEGGLKEFVKNLDKFCIVFIDVFIYVIGKEENVEVEVVLYYNMFFMEMIYFYVNNINIWEGGIYVNGFCCVVNCLFKQYGEDNGMFKKLKFVIFGEDFWEGLMVVVLVKVLELQFKGQIKGELGNFEVIGIVFCCVGEVLGYYLEEYL